jgi:hypothetical protein
MFRPADDGSVVASRYSPVDPESEPGNQVQLIAGLVQLAENGVKQLPDGQVLWLLQ